MAKMGRKPFEITEEVLNKAETLAAQGLTKQQIARVIGIAVGTLHRKVAENSDLNEAIKRGQAKGVATIANSLFQAAREGNITAQIFYLKNRDPENWKDMRHVDETRRFSGMDEDIKKTMTPQEAAQSYADTLKQAKGDNVVSIRQRKR